jgi:hypothetical protein
MRAIAIACAAALTAAPVAAQQSSSPTPAPGVPVTPHQTETLRPPLAGETTGGPVTTPPTVGGGSAPETPHQSQVLRGEPHQDRSTVPSGGQMPTESQQRR